MVLQVLFSYATPYNFFYLLLPFSNDYLGFL